MGQLIEKAAAAEPDTDAVIADQLADVGGLLALHQLPLGIKRWLRGFSFHGLLQPFGCVGMGLSERP